MIGEFAGGGTLTQEDDLYIFTTGDLTREHVDTWFDSASSFLRNWASNEIIHILLDARSGETSPYYRQRLMELNAVARSLPIKTRIVVLVKDSQLAQLSTIAHLSDSGRDHRIIVLSNPTKAELWLTQV